MSCFYSQRGPAAISRVIICDIPAEFKPQFHMFCDSTALSRVAASSFKDGLPKYAETPKEVRGRIFLDFMIC